MTSMLPQTRGPLTPGQRERVGEGPPIPTHDTSSRLAYEGDETSAECTSCLLIAKYEVCRSAYDDATAAWAIANCPGR